MARHDVKWALRVGLYRVVIYGETEPNFTVEKRINSQPKLDRQLVGVFQVPQAARHQLLNAEAPVQYQGSPYGICGGQSGAGADFPQSTWVSPASYHSTSVSYAQSYIIFLIITGAASPHFP